MNFTLTPLDFIAIAAIVWLFSRRADGGGAAASDLRMRRQVDAIMKHLGLAEPVASSAERLSPEVLELLGQGRTLDAITRYRQETGETARQARDAIRQHAGAASAPR